MCGIWGIVQKNARNSQELQSKTTIPIQTISLATPTEQFTRMLAVQQNRGKDGFGAAIITAIPATTHSKKNGFISSQTIIHEKTAEALIAAIPVDAQILIGHTLHAVVSHVLQPIASQQNKSILAANCEIYNWNSIAKKRRINARNDTELLLNCLDACTTNANNKMSSANIVASEIKQQTITAAAIQKALKPLNGVYAFAYIRNGNLVLARDIIGEKPLFFAQTKTRFYFASESKTLREILGDESYLIQELNPRHLLIVDLVTLACKHATRPFFAKQKEMQIEIQMSEIGNSIPANKDDNNTEKKVSEITHKLAKMLVNCVQERLPDPSVKIGVLFSGGVDSTLIALILKQLGRPFTCYTAAFEEEGMGKSTDLAVARQAASELGFSLMPVVQNLAQAQETFKVVIPLIESSNVVKVGVATPFYLCCKQAAADDVRVIYSGLGSEELFAGYQRHKTAADINLECISGLRKMYERDLYRDDVVSMNNTVELRLPFLDADLIRYALKIPGNLKIKKEDARTVKTQANSIEKTRDDGHDTGGNHKEEIISKYILRKAALSLGLPTAYAMRPKQAAQYGSRFDKAIQKLADKNGYALKSAYLNTFFQPKNQRLGVLFSSGKDSMYALYTMQRQAYPIACLITLQSKNLDSYMFHTPAIELAKLQAKSLQIPLIVKQTAGEKEKELADLKAAIVTAVKRFHIDGIVTGALYSVYQRERIEQIAEEIGIKVFSPLWHIDQEKELRQIIDSGFSIILTQTAAEGLDASWLGRPITHDDVDKLVALNKKLGINIAGEGGEFESLVLDGPILSRQLEILKSEIVSDGGKHTLLIKEARLINKK